MEPTKADSNQAPGARPRPHRRHASKKARASADGGPFKVPQPFVLLDAERIADLHEEVGRRVRALVRDQPYMALGGAFASGFILGGGFRTRLGRGILLAAGRYGLVQAAERYLVT